MKPIPVRLLPEVERRLARYAKARGEKPGQVAARAVEEFLRGDADLQIRLADARAAADKAHGRL